MTETILCVGPRLLLTAELLSALVFACGGETSDEGQLRVVQCAWTSNGGNMSAVITGLSAVAAFIAAVAAWKSARASEHASAIDQRAVPTVPSSRKTPPPVHGPAVHRMYSCRTSHQTC